MHLLHSKDMGDMGLPPRLSIGSRRSVSLPQVLMQEPAVECDGNPTHAMIRALGYCGLVVYAFGCAALPLVTAVLICASWI